MWNPFKPVKTPRNVKVGFFSASAIAGILLAFLVTTTGRGPGMHMISLVSFVAGPILMAVLQLIFVLPCHSILFDLKRLSLITLYFSSTVSAFLIWLLLSGFQPAFREILGMAAVISISFAVLVSLFWIFSYSDDLNESRD